MFVVYICRQIVYKVLYNFQQYILIFIEDFYLGGTMNKKGISPVIATVIIVAVAIAIAIAVAFWMTGIVGIFTGSVEQLQIVSVTANGTGGDYDIVVIAKNAGTTSVTIDGVFITPTTLSSGGAIECDPSCSNPPAFNTINTNSDANIQPGGTITLTIPVSNGTAGQSVEVKLHTASGKEYPKLIVLP